MKINGPFTATFVLYPPKPEAELFDLVLIKWYDAACKEGWHSPDDCCFDEADIVVNTVGIVVKRNDKTTVLAQSYATSRELDVGNLWCIPNGMILSIEVIKKGALPCESES
jgi:hypothetical protein